MNLICLFFFVVVVNKRLFVKLKFMHFLLNYMNFIPIGYYQGTILLIFSSCWDVELCEFVLNFAFCKKLNDTLYFLRPGILGFFLIMSCVVCVFVYIYFCELWSIAGIFESILVCFWGFIRLISVSVWFRFLPRFVRFCFGFVDVFYGLFMFVDIYACELGSIGHCGETE